MSTTHHIHGLYYSTGNSKVKFPIFNVGSGTDCASKGWCPFDADRHKGAGRKLCYAQKMERVYPSVLQARRKNADIIASLKGQVLVDVANDLADGLAWLVRNKRKADRIVRINESGDLSKGNIEFVCELIKALNNRGVKPYLYSKAPPILRKLAQEAGATVLHSERDFVAVATREEGLATGKLECPGTCGPCKACPSGAKAWILEH